MSKSKDAAGRFNAALLGGYSLQSLGSSGLPTRDNVTLTFEGVSQPVTFPILVLFNYKLMDVADFQSKMRAQSARSLFTGNPLDPREPVIAMDQDVISPELRQVVKEMAAKPVQTRQSFGNFQLVRFGDSVAYGIVNATTALIQLTSFRPNNYTDTMVIIRFAIADSKARGIENLILDVKSNGGGYICLAYGFLRYLIADFTNKNAAYEGYEIRQSPLFNSLTTTNMFLPSSYLAYKTGAAYATNNDWYQGAAKTFGGAIGTYSKRFTFNCDVQLGGVLWFEDPPYYFKKIIVLTDGLCGSACSLFISKLKHYKNVPLVFVGGFPGEQAETSSFAGGSVLQYIDFQKQAQILVPNLMPSIIHSGSLSFNYVHMYMGEQATLPREFAKMQSTYRLDTWEFSNSVAMYDTILPLFANTSALYQNPPVEPKKSIVIATASHSVCNVSFLLLLACLLFLWQ